MKGLKSFRKILERQYPDLYDKVGITVDSGPNYCQYISVDGRMRAELNYIPQKYEITISFPGNSGNLYPDISFFIRIVWGGNVNVMATFDFNGTNHFKFTV